MKLTPRQRQVEAVERELAQESAFRASVNRYAKDGVATFQGAEAEERPRDLGDYYDQLKALGAQSGPAPATTPAGRVPFGAGMTAPPPPPNAHLTLQQVRIAENAIDHFIARVEAWARGRLDLMPEEDIAKARDLAIMDLDDPRRAGP